MVSPPKKLTFPYNTTTKDVTPDRTGSLLIREMLSTKRKAAIECPSKDHVGRGFHSVAVSSTPPQLPPTRWPPIHN